MCKTWRSVMGILHIRGTYTDILLEMLLVLGRPGAGCTSLLSMLSNHRLGYAEVTGDVHFGSMTADEAKDYRGQIIMNTEEEVFFPTLTVGDTIDFATRMKVPHHLPPGIE